jgi:hypothetical protein
MSSGKFWLSLGSDKILFLDETGDKVTSDADRGTAFEKRVKLLSDLRRLSIFDHHISDSFSILDSSYRLIFYDFLLNFSILSGPSISGDEM